MIVTILRGFVAASAFAVALTATGVAGSAVADDRHRGYGRSHGDHHYDRHYHRRYYQKHHKHHKHHKHKGRPVIVRPGYAPHPYAYSPPPAYYPPPPPVYYGPPSFNFGLTVPIR